MVLNRLESKAINSQPSLEELRSILTRVQEWTRAADQKVGILTAIEAVICTFLLPEIGKWAQDDMTSGFVASGLLLSGAVIGAGIVMSVLVLLPSLANPKRSATFFGSIGRWTEAEYSSYIQSLDEEGWRREYINQIHVNACVTVNKNETIRTAAFVFLAGIGGVVACYFAALAGY